mgnify:CR=1 FL=1
MSKARELADLGSVTTRLDEVGNTDGALSNRNLIINGAMQVAQRGTSSTSNGIHTVDRFGCVYGTGTITQSQQSLTSSDTPFSKGFRSSFRATVTTPSSSSTSFTQIENFIEAQDIAKSGWDYTSPSSYVTCSFWAKSSLAGTYYAACLTFDGGSYYQNKSFTLAANTWKKITFTVSGDSSLQVDNDTGAGFQIRVVPDYGTAYTGGSEAVLDAWYLRTQSNGYFPNYAQDWQNTSGATFEITGVQLEVGDTATPFEHRSYGDELARCQRYYWRRSSTGTDDGVMNMNAYSTTVCYGVIHLPVMMRSSPTFSYNEAGSSFRYYGNNSAPYISTGGLGIANASTNSVEMLAFPSTSAPQGSGGWLRFQAASQWIAYDAEL